MFGTNLKVKDRMVGAERGPRWDGQEGWSASSVLEKPLLGFGCEFYVYKDYQCKPSLQSVFINTGT